MPKTSPPATGLKANPPVALLNPPPHPETYTFPHLSTKKAVGDMFTARSDPLPKTVLYPVAVRLEFSL